MRWACAALLLLVAPMAAQEESDAARRLVLDASRALQAGNAALFLSYFDKRETPHFSGLREDVVTLMETKVVASSVEILRNESDGATAKLAIDWLLQLTPIRELGAVESRRQEVRVHVQTGKKPKIVLFDPADFFRPVSAPGSTPAP